MSAKLRRGIFGLVVLLLGGCQRLALPTAPSPTSLPSPTPRVSPAPSPTPRPSLTPSPAALPTNASAPIIVPTPTEGTLRPCVPQNTSLKPQNMTWEVLQQGALLQALNGGVPLPNLDRALQSAGLGGYPQAVLSVDLDGDRREDAVISVIDPHSKSRPPQGQLLLFLCQGNHFAPPFAFQEPAAAEAWSAPIVHFAQDINADGRTELVVSIAHCDADGVSCEERYAILGWRQGGLQDLLQDAETPFPIPVPSLADPDSDGIYDFILDTGDGLHLVWHYQDGVWRRR